MLALTRARSCWLVRVDRGQTTARVTAEAQAAALRAADGIKSLVATLEGQTQNATANPRLVAALNANVDQETLRDLLLTEPWWEPFRRAVDGFGMYDEDNVPVVSSRLPVNFNVHAMVRDARQGARSSSGLQLAAGQVLAVAACPVALAGRSEWPVLVSTKVLDVGLLSGMAERAGGAVAISDGRRLLVAATTGAAGSGDDLPALKRGLDIPAPGHAAFGTRNRGRAAAVGRAARAGRRRRAGQPGRHADPVVRRRHPDHRRHAFGRPVPDAGAARARSRAGDDELPDDAAAEADAGWARSAATRSSSGSARAAWRRSSPR